MRLPRVARISVHSVSSLTLVACACTASLSGQTPPASVASKPEVPEWAYPGSATRQQVAPPADFRRATTTFAVPIGEFEGQSDVGSAVVPGTASFDPTTRQYTITSAGYNVWYTRDEFRYLWKRVSGDVSLAADIAYPDPKGFFDRKALLMIRQDLDDDSKMILVALHGDGMIHLAHRPEKGARVKDTEYRIGGRGRPEGQYPDSLSTIQARRLGIEKRGSAFSLFVSLEGEPVSRFGPPVTLSFTEPFYVGIGFCSHLPDVADTAVLSNVVLVNVAGEVR